jgi:arginine:ornithine antiporter/lysine permease
MSNGKLGLWILTAMVVGNMVGSGIFMLPNSLANAASPAGVLMAWLVTGFGVLMLAMVFGSLAIRKPELTGGPQAYAQALFPRGSVISDLAGYVVAWGYWVANWAGNVAIITTFASYLSTFFPILESPAVWLHFGRYQLTVGHGLTFLVCTALLWGVHFLILRGIEGAGIANFVATAAKVLGFVFFIVVTLFAFQKANLLPFVATRTADDGASVGLFGQVNNAAVATLWAFIGVESAVVLSSRARKSGHVKLATLLGLLIAVVIYLGITFLTMGALPQQQLMHTNKPLVDALSHVIGNGGSYIMAALALITLAGSTIGWILLSAEVPYQSARNHIFPKWFRGTNRRGAPTTSLWITNLMSQVLIFSTISQSMAGAFNFVMTLATLSYLVPYAVAALYHLVLVVRGETYSGNLRTRVLDGVMSVIAVLYALWVIKAGTADMKTFLLGAALLAVGLVFFPLVRADRPNSAEVGASSVTGP